jgi:ATP:corrinoid adenosyltransferase
LCFLFNDIKNDNEKYVGYFFNETKKYDTKLDIDIFKLKELENNYLISSQYINNQEVFDYLAERPNYTKVIKDAESRIKELFNSSYYFYSSSFLCCSRGEKRNLYCF